MINFRTKICGTCHSGQMTLWWCVLHQQPRRFDLFWNWQGLEGTPFFLGQLHATFDSLAELLKNFGFFTYQCLISSVSGYLKLGGQLPTLPNRHLRPWLLWRFFFRQLKIIMVILHLCAIVEIFILKTRLNRARLKVSFYFKLILSNWSKFKFWLLFMHGHDEKKETFN